MVYLPLRKCFQVTKVSVLVLLVVTILVLVERWRGGRRSARAEEVISDSDYERQIQQDEAKIIPGLGEGGGAAYLTSYEKQLGEESEKKYAINVFLSDRIAYNRTLEDHRNPACDRVVYDAELPSASVIIIFHNEPYSVVIRTLWSVVNSVRRTQPWFQRSNFLDQKTRRIMKLGYPGQDENSPFLYLKEIILVDDNSTLPELKAKLSYYVRTRLPPNLIRILRLPDRHGVTYARFYGSKAATGSVLVFLDSHCEVLTDWLRPILHRIKEFRNAVITPLIDVINTSDFHYQGGDKIEFEGLMLARMRGARSARGDVLIFLDAHCEVGSDWLRPLLQRIRHKRDAVLTPLIDIIDQSTFELEAALEFQVGGFNFMGHFTWIDVPDREKERRGSDIAATWSPTMAGGLFAINRDYYWELGAYDEQMAGWGGENLEMSFRIWQCGGTLETLPCSRVGHVFRAFHPYGMPASSDTHGINTARMAEVWMDDYKELFYLHRPDLRKNPKIGDVTHRKILREKLQCKSFEWYLQHVYKEKFVPVRDTFGYGRFRNLGTGLCLDTMQREAEGAPLGVYPCHETLQGTQYMSLSLTGQLRDEERCMHLKYSRSNDNTNGRPVLMVACSKDKRGQIWRYSANQQLIHVNTGLCLDSGMELGADVFAKPCQPDNSNQRWDIEYSEQNRFKMSGEMTEVEMALQRIRGQRRRVSRSLMSFEGFNGTSMRRHGGKKKHHKKSRKHSKRLGHPKLKNKFILKIVRTLNNNTEDHLEMDIHCKHKQLYPNNTFVRDLVTILNDKNIKVINNGRVFERNRVTEIVHDPHNKQKESKVLEKLQIEHRPDRAADVAVPVLHSQPSPPDPHVSTHWQAKRRKPKARQESDAISRSPSNLPPDPPSDKASHNVMDSPMVNPDEDPAEKKIIIEDFVEVKSGSPDVLNTNQQRSMLHKKRKRKHGNGIQSQGEGLKKGKGRGRPTKRFNTDDELEDPNKADKKNRMTTSPLDEEDDSIKLDVPTPVQSSVEDLPIISAEVVADGLSGKRLAVDEGILDSASDDNMDFNTDKEDNHQGDPNYRKSYDAGKNRRDKDDRTDIEDNVTDSPMLATGNLESGPQGSEIVMRSHGNDSHSQSRAAPLKVVMKTNLTFNLADEFFKWRRNDDGGTNLFGELSIPANTSHAPPPGHSWVSPPLSGSAPSPHPSHHPVQMVNNESSSSSESNEPES